MHRKFKIDGYVAAMAKLSLVDLCKYEEVHVRSKKAILSILKVYADRNDPWAALNLGIYHLTGDLLGFENSNHKKNVQHNYRLAEFYLLKSWRKGLKDSSYYLSWLYSNKRSYRDAFLWARRCVSSKMLWKDSKVICYDQMGYWLYRYCTVKDSCSIGIEYWRKAARLGSEYSMLQLGIVYAWGENVKKNIRMARYYLSKCLNGEYSGKAREELERLRRRN